MCNSGVDQYAYVREKEIRLLTRFFKVVEVNTTRELSLLFLHKQNVGYPGHVLNKLNKVNIQQVLNLLLDLYIELWVKVPGYLFD